MSSATSSSRIPRVRSRCSAVGTAVSGQSLVAEIAALPDDEDENAVETGDDADNELATV